MKPYRIAPYRPKNPLEDSFLENLLRAQWMRARDAHAQATADALRDDPDALTNVKLWWEDLRSRQRDWQRAWERRWARPRQSIPRVMVLADEWRAIRASQALELGQLSPYAKERLRQALSIDDARQTLDEGALAYYLEQDGEYARQLEEELPWLHEQERLATTTTDGL